MSRILPILTLAAFSTLAAAQAPIERHTPENARHYHAAPRTTEPAPGIRVTTTGPLETVATNADQTELRLIHGTATVTVDNPADGALILFDLPNGQADLLKDGLYSLNADNNTLTVVRGEADGFALNAPADAKGITVKEGETLALGANAHPRQATRAELGVYGIYPHHEGEGYAVPNWDYAYPDYRAYDDFYGYPYYPYYGYGWGVPYYGVGFGFGYGWGGGWGGYRGFGGRGFGGGGFRGRR